MVPGRLFSQWTWYLWVPYGSMFFFGLGNRCGDVWYGTDVFYRYSVSMYFFKHKVIWISLVKCVGFFICHFCKIQKLFLAQVETIC